MGAVAQFGMIYFDRILSSEEVTVNGRAEVVVLDTESYQL